MAPRFNRERPLPDGVPSDVRAAVLGGVPARPRILDLGCGAGRLGWAFAAAGDDYVAVDMSLGMLRAFAARPDAGQPRLTQADGTCLPFPDGCFDVVLLVQVLSGTVGWANLLREIRRVLTPSGAIVVGQSSAPDDGVDARMKQQLAALLADMALFPYRAQPKQDALDWLRRHASETRQTIAHWPVERSPRQFIDRHGSGARFSELPEAERLSAMRQLAAWAGATFGSLDTVLLETQRFDLAFYRFHQEATH